MSPEESAIASVVACLAASDVPYMVTGSLASTHHGRPRSTHDVDVVIDPSPASLQRLVAALHEVGFYVDDEIADRALRERRQFNAIHTETAVKLDLIIRKDREFSREELARRLPATLGGGTRVMLASPEDSVLSKLEWSRKAGGSERQIADAMGILEVQGDSLDREYVTLWAERLGVLDLWERLLAEWRRAQE